MRQKREQLGNIRNSHPNGHRRVMGCMLSFSDERQRMAPTGKHCWHSHWKSRHRNQTRNKECVRWLTVCRTQAKRRARDRRHTGRKVLCCKQCSKTKEKLKRIRGKENTLRSRLSRCKSSAPLMSWRMKISLYSPKLSRSSQAATSSVPQFWTTKVKSKTPLISTCAMQSQSRGRP